MNGVSAVSIVGRPARAHSHKIRCLDGLYTPLCSRRRAYTTMANRLSAVREGLDLPVHIGSGCDPDAPSPSSV